MPWHDATLDGEMGEGYNGVNGGMNYGQETDSTTDTSKGRFNTPSTPGDASAADGRGRGTISHIDIYPEGDAGAWENESHTGGASRTGGSNSGTYQKVGGIRTENHGVYRYEYNAVSRADATPKALDIADRWVSRGFNATICGGKIMFTSADGTTRPITYNALTRTDGSILVRNDADIAPIEIAAHEPIHAYAIVRPDIYKPIEQHIVQGGLNTVRDGHNMGVESARVDGRGYTSSPARVGLVSKETRNMLNQNILRCREQADKSV
ncbi:MAG: hypothetical protein RR994_02440 [Clostridia bacterium]